MTCLLHAGPHLCFPKMLVNVVFWCFGLLNFTILYIPLNTDVYLEPTLTLFI